MQTTAPKQTAVWLRAEDILPRLGLDGNHLLRDARQRQQYGLSDFLTLPDHFAASPAIGVAPVGHWQWRAQINDGTSAPALAQPLAGQTDGTLDFILAWMPTLRADTIDTSSATLQVRHDGLDRKTQQALAHDATTMQACVSQRMGAAPDLQAIWLTPETLALPSARYPGLANQPAAHMAAGILSLASAMPQQPTTRRAHIAHAMALRHMADVTDLRQTKGAQWLAHGLPGAIALLCAAEHDTSPPQIQHLLQQMAQQTSASLAAHATSLGAIAYASFDGWVRDYSPLAALDVVRRLSPQQITALLQELGRGVQVQYALANAVGAQRAALLLSMPLATDLWITPDGQVQGDRWRWQTDSWKRVGSIERHWQWPFAKDALRLDAWPGYERNFTNNHVQPITSTALAQTPSAQP